MPESFRAALISFADRGLTPDQRAHLQRWAADNRAEEVWQSIKRAAQKNKKLLVEGFFIREILAAKCVAISFGHRWKYRERYRKQAEQMERIAKFLREPRPAGIPPYPSATELARMLDDAARNFRGEVAVSINLPGVLKLSRKSKPPTVFMSMVGNDLNNITGCWLNQEVAVLTDIAFNAPDVIDPEDARWARRRVERKKAPRKTRR